MLDARCEQMMEMKILNKFNQFQYKDCIVPKKNAESK